MRDSARTSWFILPLSIAASLLLLAPAAGEDWPAWRGPTGLGISSERGLPLHWSQKDGLKWKIPLPDHGNSTPIVWRSRLFVTQAEKGGRQRALMAFDRSDGRLLWKRSIKYAEKEPTHEDNPFCAASPVTDGERVIALHGSAGVFAYDLEGNELWRKETGKLHHIWGNAASPVIHGERCFFNFGPGERTALAALEVRSGKELWRVEIPGGLEGGDGKTWTGSWSTPLVVPVTLPGAAREELVASYPHRLRAYDPASGKELWSCDGLGRLVYTSPVASGGLIVSCSGFMGPAMAVRAGGEGDVTATRRLWRQEEAPQRIGSAVVTGGRIFIVNDPGVAECLELETGKRLWRERLCGATWSSPVLSEDRIYVISQDGETVVFRAGEKLEVLARNPLGETTRASIAVSEGELFLRTYGHLYCISALPAK